jgi:hypothetical protein
MVQLEITGSYYPELDDSRFGLRKREALSHEKEGDEEEYGRY